MRLDKLLAHNGFGSRKDVKGIIKSNIVLVNGIIVNDPAFKINVQTDTVVVDDEIINYKEEVYYMLNKPAGYICSHDEGLYPSVLQLIDDFRTDLIIVGRLDVDTEGLLLITSNGKFSHQIAHSNKNVLKKYYIELEKEFDVSYIEDLQAGIPLDDTLLKPAKVELLDEKSLLLSISEGKFHQVKRMMHYCNNEVLYLRREQIGNLKLDERLDIGQYRELSKEEIKSIY